MPIGLGRDGAPLYANLEFLDGTRGAHVNISGISGVATKTSYATFLLYSMFHSGVLGAEAVNTKALIFNVKGEDLLFLDQPNAQARRGAAGPVPHARPHARTRSSRSRCSRRRGGATATPGPDVATRTTGVSTYYWTIADFVEGELLPFVFADAEDERQQYTMVIHNVVRKLKVDGEPVGDDGAWQIDGVTITTYHDLVELIVDAAHRRRHDARLGRSRGRAWARSTRSSAGCCRRSGRSATSCAPTSRSGPTATCAPRSPRRSPWSTSTTWPTARSASSSGVTLQRAFEEKEESGARRPLLFVVLDELNKYAPREGQSPIKDLLLDIAERGRSLGIILVGAQQTASEVERRVIANSALRVAGRLDPAEAMRPEYGFLPAAHRERARIAKPGHDVREPARDPGAARGRVPVPGLGDPARRGARRARRRGAPARRRASRPTRTATATAEPRAEPRTRSPASRAHEDPAHLGLARRQDDPRACPASTSTARVLGRDRAGRARPGRSTSSSSPATSTSRPRRPPTPSRSCCARCSTCTTPARRSS